MISKRRKLINEKIDHEKNYSIDEAISLVKEFALSKFKESIDISLNLGVDPKKSDQVVRGSTVLPNGTGKTVRVAVFAQGENADKAKSISPVFNALLVTAMVCFNTFPSGCASLLWSKFFKLYTRFFKSLGRAS